MQRVELQYILKVVAWIMLSGVKNAQITHLAIRDSNVYIIAEPRHDNSLDKFK